MLSLGIHEQAPGVKPAIVRNYLGVFQMQAVGSTSLSACHDFDHAHRSGAFHYGDHDAGALADGSGLGRVFHDRTARLVDWICVENDDGNHDLGAAGHHLSTHGDKVVENPNPAHVDHNLRDTPHRKELDLGEKFDSEVEGRVVYYTPSDDIPEEGRNIPVVVGQYYSSEGEGEMVVVGCGCKEERAVVHTNQEVQDGCCMADNMVTGYAAADDDAAGSEAAGLEAVVQEVARDCKGREPLGAGKAGQSFADKVFLEDDTQKVEEGIQRG